LIYNVYTLQNNIFSVLFVGQNLVTLKEVDSTNNFLKNIMANTTPLPEGTVIMAEEQYAGRGQQQNKWFAEAGKNLTFSILLKPVFLPLSDQFCLTQAISLGVVQALSTVTEHVNIKWPNDIYYRKQKLGGILIENMVQGSQINNSVIGIGLNINQDKFPDYLPNAISLKQILHKDYDLKSLLSEICRQIEGWYLKLRAGKRDELKQAYLDHLFELNEERSFRSKGVEFTGTITGVTDEGLLIINSNGTQQLYNLKEVEFLIN
jgi:BirA family biotin operon repressor/biotin-[acetyl-CoA-carboxylase] ligase